MARWAWAWAHRRARARARDGERESGDRATGQTDGILVEDYLRSKPFSSIALELDSSLDLPHTHIASMCGSCNFTSACDARLHRPPLSDIAGFPAF